MQELCWPVSHRYDTKVPFFFTLKSELGRQRGRKSGQGVNFLGMGGGDEDGDDEIKRTNRESTSACMSFSVPRANS